MLCIYTIKVTQVFINKYNDYKTSLLSQLSKQRHSCILPYLQWCISLGAFSPVELNHYKNDIPAGFYSLPFIDNVNLYARGDPQLMTLFKKKEKEIETLKSNIYKPKLFIQLCKSILIDIPYEECSEPQIKNTELISILSKERSQWSKEEKEYVEKISSLIYLVSPKAASIIGDHIGTFKKVR